MDLKRVYRLLAVGLLCVTGAWGVKHRIQTLRQAHVVSARDPGQQAAEQELVRLRQAAAAAPSDPAPRWALIDFYNRYHLTDKAGEQIVALIKLDPNDAHAHLALANALLVKNRFALAEAAYRDVLDVDKKSLGAWQGLSAALIKEHRYLEANVVGQHALELNRSDPNTHLLLATSALEYASQFPDPAAHAAELDFARAELEGLKKVLPDNVEVYYHLGRAYEGLHDRQGAIANLELAHKMQPDRQDIGQMLVIAYRANNNDAMALKVVEELASYPRASAPNYDLMGQLYQISRQPDAAPKALQAFKKASELVPQNPIFREHLGSAFYQIGDMESARVNFEQVTRLDPHRAYAYQQLALVYTRLGKRQLASEAARLAREVTFNEQQLTQIQELCKKHPDSVNLHLLLAKRYQQLSMPGPARDEYINVLQLDPKNRNVPKAIVRAAQASYIPLKK